MSAVIAGQSIDALQPLSIVQSGVVPPPDDLQAHTISANRGVGTPVQTHFFTLTAWLGEENVPYSLYSSQRYPGGIDLLQGEVQQFKTSGPPHGLKLQPYHTRLKIKEFKNRALERYRNVVLDPGCGYCNFWKQCRREVHAAAMKFTP